jgi:hypothetical protein
MDLLTRRDPGELRPSGRSKVASRRLENCLTARGTCEAEQATVGRYVSEHGSHSRAKSTPTLSIPPF